MTTPPEKIKSILSDTNAALNEERILNPEDYDDDDHDNDDDNQH